MSEIISVNGSDFEVTFNIGYATFEGGEFIGAGEVRLYDENGSYTAMYSIGLQTSDTFRESVHLLFSTIAKKLAGI